jgi:hypothetical protein
MYGRQRLASVSYNRLESHQMLRAFRTAAASVLALAIAALPVVLERCVDSCARHDGSAFAAVPACHHAASAAERVGRAPLACGHDHSGTTAITVTGASAGERPWTLLAAIHTVPASYVTLGAPQDFVDSSPPGPAHARGARSLTLRI